MPAVTLEEILNSLLVRPEEPLQEGGASLRSVFQLDLNAVFRWPVRRLDPGQVSELAYRRFYYRSMGCGYGVFYSIAASYAARFGAPYDAFPLEALEHKKGRFSGKGKVCGALIGAEAALALFYDRREREPLFKELAGWYESTALPAYLPPGGLLDESGEPVGVAMEMPVSVAGGRLCTESLLAWRVRCSFKVEERERKERCARLTASVAEKTVEILNRAAAR